MIKKVFIVNAHLCYKGFSEGRLNRSFVEVAQRVMAGKGIETRLTEIEKGYDPAAEVENHVWADLVILQSPVNWFNPPWIYKKYADEVFNTGLFSKKMALDDGRTRKDPSKQYGSGGVLQGRSFMMCLTWNAPQVAFQHPEQKLLEGMAAQDVFQNVWLNYKFCGMSRLPDFNCFDVYKNPAIEQDLQQYALHLEKVLAT